MANDDEAYRRAAETVYTKMEDMHEFCMKMQGDYGKWLISSLLFLHGAAIGGLLFKWSDKGPPPYLDAIWWFVIGIFLALASGFSTWCNFTLNAGQFYRWADVRMLTDHNFWPKKPVRETGIDATLWIAVVMGVLSAFCLIGGAAFVSCFWR